MTQRPVAQVDAALQAKGMTHEFSHHHMYRKTLEGVTHLVTRISHGSPPITDRMAKKMATQCVLNLGEFWQLIDCTLSAAEWDKLVTERCPDGRNPFMR